MKDLFDLSGRVVLVTGASSGIGRGCAQLLSELGAKVVIVGRDMVRLRETQSLLRGSNHLTLQHDFNNTERTLDLISGVVAEVGPLSSIVHCAGVQSTVPIRFQSSSDLDSLWTVNVTACLMLAKALRRRECHTTPASLVLFGSVAAIKGLAARSGYSASKGAVIALARSLAVELSRDNIRVNSVSPGYVLTPMVENFANNVTAQQLAVLKNEHLLGFGSTSDVANAVAFLVADTGKWITGTNLIVDGGYTCQ